MQQLNRAKTNFKSTDKPMGVAANSTCRLFCELENIISLLLGAKLPIVWLWTEIEAPPKRSSDRKATSSQEAHDFVCHSKGTETIWGLTLSPSNKLII